MKWEVSYFYFEPRGATRKAPRCPKPEASLQEKTIGRGRRLRTPVALNIRRTAVVVLDAVGGTGQTLEQPAPVLHRQVRKILGSPTPRPRLWRPRHRPLRRST